MLLLVRIVLKEIEFVSKICPQKLVIKIQSHQSYLMGRWSGDGSAGGSSVVCGRGASGQSVTSSGALGHVLTVVAHLVRLITSLFF